MIGVFLGGLLMGLMGSLHCVGMCGALALILPIKTATTAAKINGILTYNLGRVLTYTLLGTIFGIIGQGFSLAGWQQWASIAIGALMILFTIGTIRQPRIKIIEQLSAAVSKRIGTLFSQPTYRSLLSIGILNGFLPCGLVYMSIATATALGTVWMGSLFMAAFGIGTIPAMFALSFSKNLVTPQFRLSLQKVLPIFTIVVGSLLMLRGMNLGIPFISPKITVEANCVKASCCHK